MKTAGKAHPSTSKKAGGRCDMTTLATIRQAMTAFLAEAGIEALSAWPKEVWKGRKTPVAEIGRAHV